MVFGDRAYLSVDDNVNRAYGGVMSHYGPGPAGTTAHRGSPGDCGCPDCAPPRTAAATAARRRQGEERAAAMLRERGWLAFPPERTDLLMERDITGELAQIGAGRE